MELYSPEFYDKHKGYLKNSSEIAKNSEMSQDEFESWREIDIKGYRSYILFIINCPKQIQDFLNMEMKGKAEKCLVALDEICKKFIASIERINADNLSDSFMIDDILILKEKGVKTLEEVNDLIIAGYKNNSITDDFIKEINEKMYFFIESGNEMSNNGRYLLYRSRIGGKQNRSDFLN
ncbi:MAG: hypothetical protein V1667_02035 [bacterium]